MPPRKPDPHRPAVALHDCPGPGCTTRVSDLVAFCEPDEQRIPAHIREAITVAYDRGRGAGKPAHKAAIAAAVRALIEQGASR